MPNKSRDLVGLLRYFSLIWNWFVVQIPFTVGGSPSIRAHQDSKPQTASNAPAFRPSINHPKRWKTTSESRGWRESAGFRRSCAKVTREKNDSLWIQSCYRHRGSTSLLFLILAAIKLIFVIKIIQNDEFSLNFVFERELVHDRRHVARQTRETSGWLWSKGG